VLHNYFTVSVFLKEFGGIPAVTEHHTILGGKVHVYKRPNSSSWQCSSYLGRKNRRMSTEGGEPL